MIKLEWKKFRGYSPYLKYLLITLILLFSIAPLRLTWHLVQAGFFFQRDPSLMAHHMEAAIKMRPKVYVAFNKYNPALADRMLIKSLIIAGDISLLHSARPSAQDMARLQRVYKHNAYLRYLFPPLLSGVSWLENLDDVCLEILADKRFNSLSQAVFSLHFAEFPPFFMQNVADYCRWQGNTALADYWLAHALPRYVKGKLFVPSVPITHGITASESRARLLEILEEKYSFLPAVSALKENLMQAGSFDEADELKTRWTFSDVTDFGPLGSGAFTMGSQTMAGNRMLRLMGFFVKNEKGQNGARGGAWLNKRIPLSTNYYLFCFDYAAQTGKESVSFFLGDYIGERRVPAVKGQWKKALLIINGTSGKFARVQPLIRMWGKGTLLVDNVCLYKITDTGAKLPVKNTLLVEDAQTEANAKTK